MMNEIQPYSPRQPNENIKPDGLQSGRSISAKPAGSILAVAALALVSASAGLAQEVRIADDRDDGPAIRLHGESRDRGFDNFGDRRGQPRLRDSGPVDFDRHDPVRSASDIRLSLDLPAEQLEFGDSIYSDLATLQQVINAVTAEESKERVLANLSDILSDDLDFEQQELRASRYLNRVSHELSRGVAELREDHLLRPVLPVTISLLEHELFGSLHRAGLVEFIERPVVDRVAEALVLDLDGRDVREALIENPAAFFRDYVELLQSELANSEEQSIVDSVPYLDADLRLRTLSLPQADLQDEDLAEMFQARIESLVDQLEPVRENNAEKLADLQDEVDPDSRLALQMDQLINKIERIHTRDLLAEVGADIGERTRYEFARKLALEHVCRILRRD